MISPHLAHKLMPLLILFLGQAKDIRAVTEHELEEYAVIRHAQHCVTSIRCKFIVTFSDTGKALLVESPIRPYIDDTIVIVYVQNASSYRLEVFNKSDTVLFLVISDGYYTFINERWYPRIDAPAQDLQKWFSDIISLVRYPIPGSLPTAWVVGIEQHEGNLRRIAVSVKESKPIHALFQERDEASSLTSSPSYIYVDEKNRVREWWNPKTSNISKITGAHAYELYGLNCVWGEFVEIEDCHLPTTFTASDPNISEVVMNVGIEYLFINDVANTQVTFPDRSKLITTKISHNIKVTYTRLMNRFFCR